jgi:hypothetical protein
LSRTDGLEFVPEQVVEICPGDRVPKDEDEAKVKIYHCPVILFVQEGTSLLKPMSVESKFGSSSTHSFLCQVGLFAGSSGALVVLSSGSAKGFAIGMHLEAVNSAMSLADVLAKREIDGESEGSVEGLTEDVSDSCVQSVGALSKALILPRFPAIMSNLT